MLEIHSSLDLMGTAIVLCVILAAAGLASSRPSTADYWRSFYRYGEETAQQQEGQCPVTQPATTVCQTAHMITNSGQLHSQIHVCPRNTGELKNCHCRKFSQ